MTKNGRVGLRKLGCKPGDLVCKFQGLNGLSIPRPDENSTTREEYLAIGEPYVHDIVGSEYEPRPEDRRAFTIE